MKNLKTLLIPVGLIVLVVGIFSFTNYEGGEDDKKCKIKIVKMVNGQKTVVDSTFDCDENMDMNFLSQIHEMGDSLHKMIKVMMMDGDSGDFNFEFNIDVDENDEKGMKVMKFKSGDGEEVEMKFDIKVEEGEEGKNGVIKMNINGEEMEIKIDDMEKHMEEMHKQMGEMHKMNHSGDVEVIIERDEDGEESHSMKIIKTVDDEGNVVVKKIEDGKETILSEGEMEEMHKEHQMMFIGEDGEMHGDHNVTIDVKVDGEHGEKKKHIVIITKVSKDDKAAKKIKKETKATKELAVDKLRFSPNPNNGKFELSFKLEKKKAVDINIFDIQGKKVYSEKIADFNGKYSNNIDISKSGEGVYLLQIVQGDRANTSKVVIK